MREFSRLESVAAMELTKGGEYAHELLQAQAHVWNHTFSFISSMSLKCAIDLGLPDIIHNHGRPMMLSELIGALSVAPNKTAYVNTLMRLFVHTGFFALEKNDRGEEGYVLTPSSRLLLKESKTSITPFLMWELNPVIMSQWHSVSRWLQGTEESAMAAATGMGLWDYLAKNPEANNLFNGAMASDSRILMEVLVNKCGWVFQGVGSIVDVGGGTGQTAMTIARAFPHIKCTVFDRPHVVVNALQTNMDIDFVGGDMFVSIPKANAVFVKWILHDWSDEDCVKILKKCKEAIPTKEEGGKVIIVDMVVDIKQADPKATETQLYWDLLMIVHSDGRERDEGEWRKIFNAAGFNHYKISPVLGLRSIIELYP